MSAKKKYILSWNKINSTTINEKIFEEDLFEYRIIHRESFIDELCRWIGEATKDKELMKEDLKMLMSIPDEYIFSSISTNDYIYESDSRFNKTCEELLELNKECNLLSSLNITQNEIT